MRDELIGIMKEAEEAKDILIRDRAQGEKKFDDLLGRLPQDGMIYLKRGEAWETIGELEMACSDFHKAEQWIYT